MNLRLNAGHLLFAGLLLASELLVGQPVAADQANSERPPNVVLLFIDDMGYGDINAFAKADYATPNLDRLAREGRKFTDFLVSSAVCSASRAALLTGCYHQRVGISGALGPASPLGIHDDETTLAEICRSRGYATACFGKWHLGRHEKFLPTRHGFDEYYGLLYSNDMWPLHPGSVERLRRNPNLKPDYPPLQLIDARGDGPPIIADAEVQPDDQKQLTKQYTEHATRFIHENAKQPFFLYVPHSMVHVPLYVSDEFAGKSGAGMYGDTVMEVDWSVGQILAALDDEKIADDTLVIFTSDNGPWLSYGDHAGNAGPLREGKGTMFEGGVRVPTLMRWTGRENSANQIPPNSVCDKLCSTIDLLPTIAHIIGAELPPLPIDGHDVRSLLFDAAPAVSPRTHFIGYYEQDVLHSVRNERWKLHLPHTYRTLNGRHGGTGGTPVNYDTASMELALYDLDHDIAESVNVAAEHPEIVAELMKVAEQARLEFGNAQPPIKGRGVRPAGHL